MSTTRSSPASVRRHIIPMSDEPESRSQRAVALLSNGSYHVMLTSACGGYSTWRDLDVTRWREDTTRDCWGQLCYVRDLSEESAWTIGMHLLSEAADESAFEFHPGCAEFRRQHGDLEVQAAVCVVPDADAEIRVLTLINHGDHQREIELTSYAEACLNDTKVSTISWTSKLAAASGSASFRRSTRLFCLRVRLPSPLILGNNIVDTLGWRACAETDLTGQR